jgi:hypothetical protein
LVGTETLNIPLIIYFDTCSIALYYALISIAKKAE